MNETQHIVLKDAIDPEKAIPPCVIGNERLFADYAKIITFIQQLSQLERIKDFNFERLTEFLNEHARNKKVYTDPFPDDLIIANALTNNLLSSLRQVLDKDQASKSLLPKEVYKRNDGIRKGFYDDDFSFRFLYDMRNLTQHTGLAVALSSNGILSFDNNQIVDEDFDFKNIDEYKEIIDKVREEYSDIANIQYEFVMATYINDIFKIQVTYDEALQKEFYRRLVPLNEFLNNNQKELRPYFERNNTIAYDVIDDKLQAITGVIGTDKVIDNWDACVRKKANVWDKWCSENQPKLKYNR